MSSESASQDESDVLRVLQSRSETRAFYNKIANVYDLLAERSEQPMRESGLRVLAVAPGERVLEIGFGTGHCLVELAKAAGPTGKIFGIDLSENMVTLAEKLLQRESLAEQVELHCGDAIELPYATGSMDAIFMSFTLELFDTPEIPSVLDSCRRVLRPGGRIVAVGLSKEGRQGLILHALEWTHQHFPNLLDCRPIYVHRMLESSGSEVLDWKVEYMWVPVEIVLARKID